MRQLRQRALPAVAGLVAAATVTATVAASTPALAAAAAGGAAATSAAAPTVRLTAGPTLRLIAAQHNITAFKFGKRVFLDPGIWVAALHSSLRLDVSRPSYTRPLRVTQVIRTSHGLVSRRLPHSILDRWAGLRHFMRITVRTMKGRVVASRLMTFCPNTFGPARTGPSSFTRSPFPQSCGAFDPFPKSQVWGIAKGWATDPAQSGFGPGTAFKLPVGRYRVTEKITGDFARLFHIPARYRRATVDVHVVKPQNCCGPQGCCIVGSKYRRLVAAASKPLPSLPKVPLLAHVPSSALPDLVPLPSFGIDTSTLKKSHQDFLNFAATVTDQGRAPLDVEGFRKAGGPVLRAYQYFWRGNKIVGRVRAGTMGFDSKKGHNHWHFEQFATYRLLTAGKKLAVRSHKVGFCIAPTDPVNLLLPDAVWNPNSIGLGGECGSSTALWVQELMPNGWGDTYDQFKAGQAFNITNLPNGTYYIEVVANPEHVLHEATRSNDISLRKVIISGTPGHRHVRVPAWHGIDPENH
jgi:hypothetical protein